MQDQDKPTAASAVELDETALDGVQGGVTIKHASTVMHKKAPEVRVAIDGITFTAPGDVAGLK